MGERNASLEPSSDGKQEIGRGLRTMPTVKAKNDQSERVKGIMGSASVLVAILVIFSFVSALMLFRLFQTSSELAKSNRRAFILETKNKTTVLDEYFRKRVAEFTSLSSDEVFQTYFAAGMLNIPNKQGIGVVAGQLEQKLLVSRLAEEEQGKPVYSRMAFFDIVRGRVVARTDNSPKGRWINAAFFEGLRFQTNGTSKHPCTVRCFRVQDLPFRAGQLRISESRLAAFGTSPGDRARSDSDPAAPKD
jgi:hypothetical protein